MSHLRSAAPWIAVACVALLLRVLVGGWTECRAAREELRQERPFQAVVHYERAVRWYLPGNPFVRQAADAMEDMANEAENAGDVELALFAFRGLRSAAYSTRSFFQPMPRRIARAEERIASLMTADPAATWPDRALPADERRAIVLTNLRQHTDPDTLWVVLLELGFLAWLGAGVALAWRVGRSERKRRTTWILATTAATGYLLWIAGMWLA